MWNFFFLIFPKSQVSTFYPDHLFRWQLIGNANNNCFLRKYDKSFKILSANVSIQPATSYINKTEFTNKNRYSLTMLNEGQTN